MPPVGPPSRAGSGATLAASTGFASVLSRAGGTHAPADQATVRRSNLALVLQTVRTAGQWSRAKIASETGLNKATVSSLVSELIQRRLVSEGEIERGGMGRPGQIVGLDRSTAFFIGLEINVDYVAGVVTDLAGVPVARQRLSLDVRGLGPARTLARAAELAVALLTRAGSGAALAQAVSINVAIPGMIDADHGILAYAPNLEWRDVDITHTLRGLIGMPRTRITVDNDANMAAVAEFTSGTIAGARDLVVLTGEVGIGGGVVAGGELLRGARGFFGEVGHMAVASEDVLCGCGRRRCWEALVGLAAILRAIAEPGDPLHDPSLDLVTRLQEIERRADAGDARTLEGLTVVAKGLGQGASILVNIFNPEVIVFGGYFAALSRFFDKPLKEELYSRIIAPEGGGCRVEYSTLGFEAAALGGAHAGIHDVMTDPSLVDASGVVPSDETNVLTYAGG